MTQYLLDTNILIGLAKGEVRLKSRLAALDPSRVFVCSVVRAELAFGARKSDRVAKNLESLHRLLEPFVSLGFDDLAADHYGQIRADLERSGTPIGANDLLIAAIARSRDLVLVSRNSREFARVAGLRFESWDS